MEDKDRSKFRKLMKIKTQIQNLDNYRKYLKVVRSIESFLDKNNFQKLDLPVLLPALIPESYLEVFETEYIFFDKKEKLYLAPSPEMLIKRLIVAGIGNCYYLGKSFRNSEPVSSRHSGEFTMLELYKVGANYMEMADIVLELLQKLCQITDTNSHNPRFNKFVYQGRNIDFSRWEKITVVEAFEKYADIRPDELFDHERFRARALQKGYKIENEESATSLTSYKPKSFSYEELWSQIYTNEVESHLGIGKYPTLIYDYPIEFASLSKPNADGKTAQRFEFYIAGLEIGNCYSELTDCNLQESRLVAEQQERKKSGRIDLKPDLGFLDALKIGMPECSGIAIGVERLAMIFANVDSIDKIKLISLEE